MTKLSFSLQETVCLNFVAVTSYPTKTSCNFYKLNKPKLWIKPFHCQPRIPRVVNFEHHVYTSGSSCNTNVEFGKMIEIIISNPFFYSATWDSYYEGLGCQFTNLRPNDIEFKHTFRQHPSDYRFCLACIRLSVQTNFQHL